MAIKTYPEMNETIKDLLRRSEEPMEMDLYILARIEELEQQVQNLTPPPNAPLTLEELREMDGEIVYIKPLNDWAKIVRYGLLYFGTRDCSEWREGIGETYGDSWVAYRRKPEEGRVHE